MHRGAASEWGEGRGKGGGFTFLMELEGGGEGRGGPDEGVFGVQMKGRGGVYRCPNKGKGEGVPVSKWDKKRWARAPYGEKGRGMEDVQIGR